MKIDRWLNVLLLGCLLGGVLLSGCSQSHRSDEMSSEKLAVGADASDEAAEEIDAVLEEAEEFYAQGCEHYKHHRWVLARQQFDLALNLLLNADVDDATHDRLSDSYDKLFERIHKLEIEEQYRQGLAQQEIREEAESSDELEAFLSSTRSESASEADAEEVDDSTTTIFTSNEGTLGKIVIDESDELVAKYVKEFSKSHSQYRKGLERAEKYLPVMLPIFKAHRLPPELTCIPLIESNFKVDAVSPAGAVGLWQFVRGTGKNYDLRINSWVDERRDPKKSSEAAAKYLQDLYNMLGDWDLAFAGYYMGEYKVHNAIGRHRTRDLSALAETRAFGNGAKHYVARIKAAILLAKSPEKYGLPPLQLASVPTKMIDVRGGSDLKQVAGKLEVTYDELRQLNPELKQGTIPSDTGRYALRIPKNTKDIVVVAQADREQPKKAAAKETRAKAASASSKSESASKKQKAKTEYLIHRIRRGENLSTIASKYKVDADDIKKANHIRNTRSLQVGQKLKVPVSPHVMSATANTPQFVTYRVEKGDTLYSIAERYHVDVDVLKSQNKMKRTNKLKIGQALKVPVPVVASKHAKESSKRMLTYRVKRGDSLSKIASSFGVSVNQLRQWNGFEAGTTLYPGSRITVWY